MDPLNEEKKTLLNFTRHSLYCAVNISLYSPGYPPVQSAERGRERRLQTSPNVWGPGWPGGQAPGNNRGKPQFGFVAKPWENKKTILPFQQWLNCFKKLQFEDPG